MTCRILAINLGATSTKIAYYEDETCIKKESLSHDAKEVNAFPQILDQYGYRLNVVKDFMAREKISAAELDAIVSRGGHTRPIPSGTYRINNVMLDEILSGKFGRHPCDIGSYIAVELCKRNRALPLIVDPPVTDEFDELARISGIKEIQRFSRFHALNQKAIAREAAAGIDKPYEDLNLIVAHMGGGISVCAHKKGRMVDANNALEGEGPYSPTRSGGLCAFHVAKLCFEGYTEDEIFKRINGAGGLVSYLGTSDLIEVEKRIKEGDKEAQKYFDGMCYQIAKEIGAMATVLEGDIDGIVLTGGMANSKLLTSKLEQRVSFLSKVYIYPGENEMKALALGALRGLRQECEILTLNNLKDSSES